MGWNKVSEDAPIYGNGRSGEIVHSSDATEGGVINATRYEIQSGATVTVDSNILIRAQEEIIIDGTLDATGQGGNAGSDNKHGYLSPHVNGGSRQGHQYGNYHGGAGGDGDTNDIVKNIDTITPGMDGVIIQDNIDAGAGGGDGGDGATGLGSDQDDPADGNAPGGGGSAYATTTTGSEGAGGAGGAGGGLIYLSAPKITINGSVLSEGEDGGDGEDAYAPGGGGGGGSGGVIVLISPSLSENGTVSVNAGLGGIGGDSGRSYTPNGGDGADGKDGFIIRW